MSSSSSSTGPATGESRRRAEIESKRAKLAELKRAREERTSRLQAGRSSDAKSGSEATTPSSRRDIDDLVANLVGSRMSAGAGDGRGTPSSPRKSGAGTDIAGSRSDYDGASEGQTTMVNRADSEAQATQVIGQPRPKLVDSEVQTDAPDGATSAAAAAAAAAKKEKVYYTKEIQTTLRSRAEGADGELDSDDEGPVGDKTMGPNGISIAAEEAIRAKVLKEQETERLKAEEERMKQEEDRLEREIEEGLRELTGEELGAIYGQSEFAEFVEQSSKIIERALTDTYDYLKDYTVLDDRAADDYEGRQVKSHRVFWDEKLCRGRSVTALDWSTKHPELVVVSYSRSEYSASDEPDGLVLVWNMHLADRPEFVFHAQTDVLSVTFSPFHPNLVIGGTYSGQILIWDTRARSLPVLKTPLSAAGHTHPVYALQLVGTQNAHNLVTASTDGTVCSWMLDMLARPQETLELLNTLHPKTDEVSVTTIAFPDQETTTFWVGTEEGTVYQAGRYDRAGAKAGLNLQDVFKRHTGPVTGLHFHPLAGPVDFSDLFLSSSMDWTCRLWRSKKTPSSSSTSAATTIGGVGIGSSTSGTGASGSGGTAGSSAMGQHQSRVIAPVLSFDEASDYVYDVRWHPLHPALFAQVDGSGRLELYNLNVDTERPIISTLVGAGRALNKVGWDRKEGRKIAMGGAEGKVYVYDVGTLAVPAEDEWFAMQKTVARLLSATAAGATASGAGAISGSGNGLNSINNGASARATGLSGGAMDSGSTARTNLDLERISQRLAVR